MGLDPHEKKSLLLANPLENKRGIFEIARAERDDAFDDFCLEAPVRGVAEDVPEALEFHDLYVVYLVQNRGAPDGFEKITLRLVERGARE